MLRERSLGTVIEWASKIDGALPTERVEVRLAHRGPTDRAIEIFDRRNDGQGRARLLDALVTLFGAVEVAPAASQCPSCGKDESSPDHAIKSVPTLFLAVSAVGSGHSQHKVTVRVGCVDCCQCRPDGACHSLQKTIAHQSRVRIRKSVLLEYLNAGF
jgi:hypothetical protein